MFLHQEYNVITLSLDLAVDEVYGNLADKAIVQHWITQCRNGLVVGIVAGPPCETWSAVRHNQLQSSSPPPLRSEQFPWGLDMLELTRYQQLAVGSTLLQTVLLFIVVLLGTGGFAHAEHPAISKSVAASASKWKLSYTKWLLRSAAFALYTSF